MHTGSSKKRVKINSVIMYKYKYKQEADMRACGECMHMKILAQAAVKLACYSCNFLVPISTCVTDV